MPTIAWRRDLKRKLAWSLAIKLAALLALNALFFAPADRPPIDPAAAADHLGLHR